MDCNDVTGQCNCKATWNGTNCDVDVNECDLGTNDCNSTIEICVNRDDGWNCSCLYGSTNGVCNGIYVFQSFFYFFFFAEQNICLYFEDVFKCMDNNIKIKRTCL